MKLGKNLLILFLLLCNYGISQDTPKKEKTSSVLLYGNWSSTNRLLKVNEGLFGDSLGKREDETKRNLWSFGLGIRSELTENLAWEGGIAYMQNGEEYAIEELDTAFSYTTSYSYISMPIKLLYTYGNKIKLITGAGFVPQMLVGYKQSQKWTDSDNVDGSAEITARKGLSTFVLSAVFDLGVEVRMAENWTFYIVPEYKLQLSNSFDEKNSFKHYGRSFGINVGIGIAL